MNTKTPKSTQTKKNKKITQSGFISHKKNNNRKTEKKLVSVLFKTGKSSLHFFSLMTTPISGDQLCTFVFVPLEGGVRSDKALISRLNVLCFSTMDRAAALAGFFYKHVQRSYPVADRIVSSGPPPRSLLGTSPSSLSPCLPRILLPQC